MGSAYLPAVGRRPFRDPALPRDQRVDDPLQRLTLEERIALLHRVAWLGGVTVFPQAVGLGTINRHAGRDRIVTVQPFAGHDGCYGCYGSNPPTPLASPHRRGLAPEL